MKFPFFKTLLVAGSIALVCSSCGDDSSTGSSEPPSTTKPAIVVDEASFLYQNGKEQLIIGTDGVVKNLDGDTVAIADINSGVIVNMDGSIMAESVDFTSLEVIMPTVISSTAWVLSADQTYVIYPDGAVTDAAGTKIGTINFETDPATGAITTVGTIVSLDGVTPIIETIDVSTLKIYESNVKVPEIPSSSSVETPSVGTPTPSSSSVAASSSSEPKSSSSSVKSSSSSVKSSSSSATPTGGCPTIKYVSGGASGSGFASRYWDCCKPSCSWAENAHGNPSKQCDARGNTISDLGASSMCNGGPAGTCTSQIPFTIDGCTQYAFAFAAVPASNGGQCGHCYELTFTGEGHYSSTNSNTKKLKSEGKKLIVMASNVGSDVQQGQFDVMIPGGGVGLFNGCAGMGWGSQGETYGGLLSECEKEKNYNAGLYKSCLTNKCNATFSNDPVAKEGCLFLANWMNSAGNPEHTYKEVECPEVLKMKY